MSNTVIIGSARCDENGNLKNGQAGDQTRKEVSTQAYYMHKKGWVCIRAKDTSVRAKLAKAMKQACANNNIGYDQWQRDGVITKLKKYGTLEKISEKTECDCSRLVCACIIQATGVNVGNFRTCNEPSMLYKSGLFEKPFTVSSANDLKEGDILCTPVPGHTVIVVSVKENSKSAIGVTTANLYMRVKPYKDAPHLCIIPAKKEVYILGKETNGWYHVQYNNKEGYSSGKYIEVK